MARIREIRAGIAANLTRYLPNVQCTGYLLVNPMPPAFEVELATTGINYDRTMARGLDEWTFTIRGFAPALDQGAQELLDEWLASSGPQSVKEALEFDRTLKNSVSDSRVERVGQVRAYSPIASPSVTFFGAEWTLRAFAPGE